LKEKERKIDQKKIEKKFTSGAVSPGVPRCSAVASVVACPTNARSMNTRVASAIRWGGASVIIDEVSASGSCSARTRITIGEHALTSHDSHGWN